MTPPNVIQKARAGLDLVRGAGLVYLGVVGIVGALRVLRPVNDANVYTPADVAGLIDNAGVDQDELDQAHGEAAAPPA